MRIPNHQRVRDLMLSALFALGIVWLTAQVWGLYGKQSRAHDALVEMEESVAAIEKRRETLTNDIATLETARGEEALVRSTLGVAREGEEVLIVVPPEHAPVPLKLSWWQRLLRVIGF